MRQNRAPTAAGGREARAETLHMLLNDVHDPVSGKHDLEYRFMRRLWGKGLNDGAHTDRKRMSKTVADFVVPDVQKSLAKPQP